MMIFLYHFFIIFLRVLVLGGFVLFFVEILLGEVGEMATVDGVV